MINVRPFFTINFYTHEVIIHDAKEGGFWAEVPVLPGCASQGDNLEQLMENIREAIGGWLEDL